MRYKYAVNTLSFVFVFFLDFIVQSIFNLSMSTRLLFVSQMHFILLVLYAREDSRDDIVLKVVLVAFFMDLIQYKSFPVYYISYGLAIMLIRFWHRHISDSYMEFVLLTGVALFVKEILLFMSLRIMNETTVGLTSFIVSRSLWVVLGNLLLFYIPYKVYRVANKSLKDYSSRNYR